MDCDPDSRNLKLNNHIMGLFSMPLRVHTELIL